MSDHAKLKVQKLSDLLDEITALTATMEELQDGKAVNDTPDNRAQLTAKLSEADALQKSIEQDRQILGLKSFLQDPMKPAGGDGAFSEEFGGAFGAGVKTLGEQFVESEGYKALDGKVPSKTLNVGADLKGFLDNRLNPVGSKATFTTGSTSLDSSRNYIARPVELIQQQRLTIRDLLPVGETTQGIVYFIQEQSFTNGADMVGEEGEKPEATLVLTNTSAQVKKIAVTLKVTDEMYADFPQLRDYINTRLNFMVSQKEEDQLLNGDGTGNNITGILQTSGIQTQAKGGDTNLDAIHKAKTKVMKPTTGGYNPTGLIINPTDWELLRLAKDANNQYFGGGPFVGEYGVGQYVLYPPVWGLTPVITTAIAAGTALVGDFNNGAQIWQREGIRMESTNSNEDDFNFNRISIRVEERLALTVYAPGAFCKVTGIT